MFVVFVFSNCGPQQILITVRILVVNVSTKLHLFYRIAGKIVEINSLRQICGIVDYFLINIAIF